MRTDKSLNACLWTGRALECAAPQIKVSLRPQRTGAATPALQVRAVPPSSVDLEEAKRRRTSYSTLPTSFILSLVQPLPAGVRGMYLLEAEVTHGDMEIQLRVRPSLSYWPSFAFQSKANASNVEVPFQYHLLKNVCFGAQLVASMAPSSVQGKVN